MLNWRQASLPQKKVEAGKTLRRRLRAQKLNADLAPRAQREVALHRVRDTKRQALPADARLDAITTPASTSA